MPPPAVLPTSAAGSHRLLGDATRLGIINALRTAERTVVELAETTGMHRNTVRSHLEKLASAGVVESSIRQPAGRGRPAHSFRLVHQAHTGHQTPFTEGLIALVRQGHGHEAAAVAEEQGRAAGESLAGGDRARSDAQAVDHAADAMRRIAFEPTVRRQRGGYQIDIIHCPYWGAPVSRDGDILCSFHQGMVQGMLDATRPGRFTVRVLPMVELNPCRCEVQLDTSPS